MYDELARIIIAERHQEVEKANRLALRSQQATRPMWRTRLAEVLRAVAARIAPAGEAPITTAMAQQ
jgi:hypothetical protein